MKRPNYHTMNERCMGLGLTRDQLTETWQVYSACYDDQDPTHAVALKNILRIAKCVKKGKKFFAKATLSELVQGMV